MALKTAIYMRVSTQDQCVDSQRQERLKFIEKRDDLELAGEYADVISGVREKRAELDRLIIDAKQRKIDAVLFFDISRLTRKGTVRRSKFLATGRMPRSSRSATPTPCSTSPKTQAWVK